MPGQVTAATDVTHPEEPLVEDVGHEDSQEELNIQIGALLVDSDLDDEGSDAAVQHHEVPIHPHHEKAAKRVPSVREENRLLPFQVFERWPVEQFVNQGSLLDILLRVVSHLLNASHKQFVHHFTGRLSLVDAQTVWNGVIS